MVVLLRAEAIFLFVCWSHEMEFVGVQESVESLARIVDHEIC